MNRTITTGMVLKLIENKIKRLISFEYKCKKSKRQFQHFRYNGVLRWSLWLNGVFQECDNN